MVKRSNIHHISIHISKSTVLLSLPDTTTISSLREQLIPALTPLAAHLPTPPPTSPSDLQLWEDVDAVEGAEGPPGIRVVEENSTIGKLGWPRWKRLYVSFRQDGTFPQPQYTVPDPTDGDDDE